MVAVLTCTYFCFGPSVKYIFSVARITKNRQLSQILPEKSKHNEYISKVKVNMRYLFILNAISSINAKSYEGNNDVCLIYQQEMDKIGTFHTF